MVSFKNTPIFFADKGWKILLIKMSIQLTLPLKVDFECINII